MSWRLHVALCVIVTLFFGVMGYIRSHDQGQLGLRFTPVNDLLSSLKTGDLIFTKASCRNSMIQQWMFGSYINHCAMVYRAFDGGLWVWDCSPFVGGYMTPLVEFIHHNWLGRAPPARSPPVGLSVSYVFPRVHEDSGSKDDPASLPRSKLFIRRINKPLDEHKTLQVIQKNIGRPYSYRFWLSAYYKATMNLIKFPIPWAIATDPLGMFCSELIAHTFAASGAINTAATPPSSVLPHDFWSNSIAFANGYRLDKPEQLYGDIDGFLQIPVESHVLSSEDALRLWIEGAKPDLTTELALRVVDALHA